MLWLPALCGMVSLLSQSPALAESDTLADSTALAESEALPAATRRDGRLLKSLTGNIFERFFFSWLKMNFFSNSYPELGNCHEGL